MHKVQIANILLTRRCNLRCDYCRLVRDIPEVPEYPTMKYYRDNELDYTEWIDIFDRLHKNNPNIFFVIYGGEPFLYNDLADILTFCHDKGINYTVITNNTDAIQDRIEEVLSWIGKFKGFTSSVDPLMLTTGEQWKHVREKSKKGFQRLVEMVEGGRADDVVAEITAMQSTIPYLYDTVKMLSNHGIYSSITTLDQQKTKYYDFSMVCDENELVQQNKETLHEFRKIKKDKSLLIHIPKLLDAIYEDLPCNMGCVIYRDVHNVTIDSDGSARLCLRIRGTFTPSNDIRELIDQDGVISKTFLKHLEKDYIKYCNCCIWTCMYMSGRFSEKIIEH